MSDLRGELKEWERAFRADHGRDPTKDDIRQQPAIAAKYKEYAKLKAGKGKAPEKPASSKQAPSKPPPPASNPFKTPTKPKPARGLPRPAASTSTDGPAPGGSPSKRLSSGKPTSNAGPTFVLANSPSKLRALAAAHSTSGSPNRPQGGAWAGATLAPSDAVTVSPQKRAVNPFASPQKGTFGELERAERERLRARKRAEREKARARNGDGVLGTKATTQGAGWGTASSVPGANGRSAFARTESTSSIAGGGAMELDEVDDFFSSQSSAAPTQTQGSQRLLAQLAKASSTRPPPVVDDDEVFGPSPVKSTAGSAAFPGEASTSAPPKCIFKPLVPDSPPHVAPSAPAHPTTKPKPFTSSLPSAALLLPSSTSTSTSRKRLPAPADDEPDTALDDADDDFYADALDQVEAELGRGGGGGAKGGSGRGRGRARGSTAGAAAKRKKVAPGATGAVKAKAKGKGKARAANAAQDVDEEEMDFEAAAAAADADADDEVRVVSSSRAGELVLDVEREEALGGGRERLVIHEKGWRERLRAQEREERRRRAEVSAGAAHDGEGALDVRDRESDEEDVVDEVSLFHQRASHDLLSRLRADAPPSAEVQEPSDARHNLEASLPADLAAVLSLRASPRKSQSSAKERQVARLLGEPATRRRQTGLLELAGETEDGADEAEAEQEEGDDDWDDEPDGWKTTGDVMDGYYSADGW